MNGNFTGFLLELLKEIALIVGVHKVMDHDEKKSPAEKKKTATTEQVAAKATADTIQKFGDRIAEWFTNDKRNRFVVDMMTKMDPRVADRIRELHRQALEDPESLTRENKLVNLLVGLNTDARRMFTKEGVLDEAAYRKFWKDFARAVSTEERAREMEELLDNNGVGQFLRQAQKSVKEGLDGATASLHDFRNRNLRPRPRRSVWSVLFGRRDDER